MISSYFVSAEDFYPKISPKAVSRLVKLAMLGFALAFSVTSSRAASSTWLSSANTTWSNGAAWSSGIAPGVGDTAVFVTGTATGNIQINQLATAGGITIGNIADSDTNGPVFFTVGTGIYLLTVTGTFNDTATAGSTVVRNNGAGLLNFVGNVVSNTGGGNLEFGFNGASNPLNAYSANSTIVDGSSLTGFNVTGTASLGDVTVGSHSTLLLQDATTAGSNGVATAKSLSGTGGIVEVSANAVTTNTATLILTNSGSSAFYGQVRDGVNGNQNQLSVIMNGNGTQVLTGNNTYTGTTQILNGTLQLGDGVTTSGNLATTSSVVLTPTGTLAYANVGAQNAQSSISGTGSVAILTGTTVFLAGTRTYSGTTSISSGATLQVGNFAVVGGLSNASAIVDNGNLSFAKSNAFTYSNVISGTGAVQQLGSGTTILSGINTYTGATTISAGTLLVRGGLSSSTSVTVAGGATLGVGKAAGAASFLALNVSTLDAGSGGLESVIKFNLDNTGNDSLTTGAFTLNGEPVNLILTSVGTLTGTYTLMTWTSGGFTDLATQLDLAGSSAGITLSQFSLSGNSLVFTAVPEPSTFALLGIGFLALVILRQKRRTAS